jgi:alpha-beta hydrolase superfamily lysophospholipase
MDPTDIAKITGSLASALTIGSALLYKSYRKLKTDSASDKRYADERRTDEAASAMQRRTMELVAASVEQWKAVADQMQVLARNAETQAHRDRRLRQVAEARLARVQKQSAEDRASDRREVERLQRRIADLEAIIGNRRTSDAPA